MDDVKKIVEEYKNQNGNNNYTQKDLLWYIIKRLDDIDKINCNQDKKIERNATTLKIFLILLPIGITLAGIVGSLM